MATHLVKEGYSVHGFDVFPASVERFAAAGGIPTSSLEESAREKDFYVCMVASAPQVQSVLFGGGGIVAGKHSECYEGLRKEEEKLNRNSTPIQRDTSTLLHRPGNIRPICSGGISHTRKI